MIIQDKTSYRTYLEQTAKNVESLFAQVSSSLLTTASKEEIDAIHTKICAKIALIKIKTKTSVILETDWIKYKQQIEELYKKLETKVNVAVANAHVQQNQEYPLVNHR